MNKQLQYLADLNPTFEDIKGFLPAMPIKDFDTEKAFKLAIIATTAYYKRKFSELENGR